MATNEQLDQLISGWLEETAPARIPERVFSATFEQTRKSRQHGSWRALLGRWNMPRFVPALGSAAVIVVAAALALNFFNNQPGRLGSSPSASPIATSPPPSADPPVGLGIFEPVAGRIVYGSENGIYGIEDGIWGLDPASSDPATTVQLTSEPATPLGWSADGTRLLIQQGGENLFVLHADGSETQVVENALSLQGATISPDGSRVVYADQSASSDCEDGVLMAVDVEGGPSELLLESPRNKKIQHPTFSPDGTQIAFTDGNCDSMHIVWVMNADGTDAHQITSSDFGPLGATHVYGLAWSPRGDRIALSVEQGIYTIAPDGSDFVQLIPTPYFTSAPEIYWSPDGSRITYVTGCGFWDADDLAHECTFVIRNPDGDSTDVQLFDYGIPGPWHPSLPPVVFPATPPDPTVQPTSTPVATPVQPAAEGDEPLGWSSDGNRLLIQRAGENLFILHTDGSETQVTQQLSGFSEIPGSSRPSGATISPGGSRVVFAGLTTPWQDGRSCHDGALFAVGAGGGPAEVLWESHRDGIVRDPTYSPDGTQIAFVDGNCDSDHSVWLKNVDGSDAYEIVSSDIGPLGATHVHGLAWSPAGDRIAIQVDEGTFTFAPDGSDFRPTTDVPEYCWPGEQC